MEFKLSDHAQKRIQQRRIKPEWIKAAIDNPDQFEDDLEDPTLAHALNPDCPLEASPIVGASLLAKYFASKLAPTMGSWPNGLSGLKAIPENGFKKLRVIYNETTEPVTIVTACFE